MCFPSSLLLFRFYFQEYICTLFCLLPSSLLSLISLLLLVGKKMNEKGSGKKLMDSVWKVLLAPNHTSSLFISLFLYSPFFSLSPFSYRVEFLHQKFSAQIERRVHLLFNWTKGYFKTRSVNFNPLFLSSFPFFSSSHSFTRSVNPFDPFHSLPVNIIVALKSDRRDCEIGSLLSL